MIRTTRLYIRPTERRDLPCLMQWWNDPLVMESVGFPHGLGITMESMDDWFMDWVERDDPSRGHFVIVDTATDTAIGEIYYKGLDREQGSTWIGIKIGERDFWRMGFAKEAMVGFLHYLFTTLGLQTVCLDLRADNTRAYALYQNVGFEEKSTPGSDVIEMQLIRRDFQHRYL